MKFRMCVLREIGQLVVFFCKGKLAELSWGLVSFLSFLFLGVLIGVFERGVGECPSCQFPLMGGCIERDFWRVVVL